MSRIGVLGGMGPAASVDFLAKLVAVTPASRDQDHLPVIMASLPQIPDRTPAILGYGRDPLPELLAGVRLLNDAGAGLIAIPCSSSHHWYDALSAASRVPILHIARVAVAQVPREGRVLILATRGALASGFFQRELAARGVAFEIPADAPDQGAVDECIRLVKCGRHEHAGERLGFVLARA